MESKKHVFSTIEKKVFVDIITKYEGIVENKQTDGSTLKSKNNAWELITREFNANSLTTAQASTKQLRRLWMNLKQRQRDVLTKERQHRLATGGGPSTSAAVVDPDVCSILTPGLLVSVPGAMDSDTATEILFDNLTCEPEISNSCRTTYSIHTPSPPKSPQQSQPGPIYSIQQVLQTEPPLPTTKSYQTQKKTLIEREYQDRKARANEIHQMELNILKERLREAKANAELAEYILKLRKGVGEDNA